MSDFTVAVCTFGDQSWVETAQRAIASAEPQAPVVHVHGETLHGARNDVLDVVETPWVIYLDADDELEPGYVAAMSAGSGDLRAPQVRYVRLGSPQQPSFPRVAGHGHDCDASCLTAGNWLVVGTAVRVDMVRAVGGWEPWEWSEDWALWARCWKAGATVERAPEAIYRAHVRADSRNRAPDRALKNRVHWEIHRAVFGEAGEAAA